MTELFKCACCVRLIDSSKGGWLVDFNQTPPKTLFWLCNECVEGNSPIFHSNHSVSQEVF